MNDEWLASQCVELRLSLLKGKIDASRQGLPLSLPCLGRCIFCPSLSYSTLSSLPGRQYHSNTREHWKKVLFVELSSFWYLILPSMDDTLSYQETSRLRDLRRFKNVLMCGRIDTSQWFSILINHPSNPQDTAMFTNVPVPVAA